MKRLIHTLLVLLACSSTVSADDILVVVSKDSSVDQISKRELVDLYMGRTHSLPDGSPVMKVDAPIDSPVRAAFYQTLIGMSVSEVNAYWARLMFTGRATPPMNVMTLDDLATLLANNPNALGYLTEANDSDKLKTILVIEDNQDAL